MKKRRGIETREKIEKKKGNRGGGNWVGYHKYEDNLEIKTIGRASVPSQLK